jgi:hypothetical protein
MSIYSNNSVGSKVETTFTHHHVYEVANNLSDSKHIADDYASGHRYQHRATATVIGYPELRPYDPIYLDGLPNGLSGYWTVLSVKHVFGGRPADYMLELEVGTDFIGDTNPDAYKSAANRDVQADLAGQSLTPADVVLTTYSVSPNASPNDFETGEVKTTAIGQPSNVAIPEVPGTTPFASAPPNTDFLKSNVQWTSIGNGKVVE